MSQDVIISALRALADFLEAHPSLSLAEKPPADVPTLNEIKQWPATVDPPTAGLAFGISRSYSYELIKRGEFPAQVIEVGGVKRVVTASVLQTLGGAT